MVLTIKGHLLVKSSVYRKCTQIHHFTWHCLTKLKQQLFYLVSWSRIIMTAEVSLWESIFLLFFLASMNRIPLGSVKKDFCIKLLLYSTPNILLFFQLQLADLKISLISESLVRKKKLNYQIVMTPFSKIILQRRLLVFNNLCYTIILKEKKKTLRTRLEQRSYSDFVVYLCNTFHQALSVQPFLKRTEIHWTILHWTKSQPRRELAF